MVESLTGVVFGAFTLGSLGTIAKAALGLGFVIFVHELGHFLVAKWCGVKCEKFYVGFDVPISLGPIKLPRALWRKQWGETEYGIGIVPLGGHVKMLGQDDNPANASREAERIRMAREEGIDENDPVAADAANIDPRSYPAKTVPQRLAIISAGVIMNLIFAVIFAACAYRMGVSYTPTVVGSASPGLSAWNVGLQPGDRILQMGRSGQPSSHLRFQDDMMAKVLMTGAGQDLDLLVQRYATPGATPRDPEWVTVRLSSPQPELQGRPVIGITSNLTNVSAVTDESRARYGHLPGCVAGLEQGDRIVAINGQPVFDYTQILAQLALHVDDELTLQVESVAKDARGRPILDADVSKTAAGPTKQVTIPRFPYRSLGLHLTMGPIVGVQKGSIAEQAGFQVGDQLVSVQGQPVSDPMALPDQLRRLAGQEVAIEVRREGSEQPVALKVTPQVPKTATLDAIPGRPLAAESIGLAFQVENTVAAIEPGSPAETAGLQVGDLIEAAEFVPDSPENLERDLQAFGPPQPIELGPKSRNWATVQDRIQMSLPGTRVKLSYQRGQKLLTADLLPVDLPGRFYANRGLQLMPMSETNRASDWASAFRLGLRETIESIRQVYFILYRLVTGQFSPKNLGGPLSIATMAGIKASEGVSSLLTFLTLLSANLAVVNFLPIPVLDGGHAVFLIYEGIFRKPLNERVAFGLTMLGFCFILGLMLFVLGLDLLRFANLAS